MNIRDIVNIQKRVVSDTNKAHIVQASPELKRAILWITAQGPCPALSGFVTAGLAALFLIQEINDVELFTFLSSEVCSCKAYP